MRIEAATIHDLAGTYRVCLQTGDRGEDATALHADPDLLGHCYVGPYLAIGTGTQLVLVDEAGVCGYLLSTDDTLAFDAWAEAHWWPTLRARYRPGTADPRDAWLVERIHGRETLDPTVLAEYPAHLHIDLLERARGTGMGRRLIERLLDELRSRGVPGVHLGVDPQNTNAIGFYQHLGFRALDGLPDELVMGRRLTDG